ncbi:HD domain-containing protein [Chloroflexota bacterium]
MPTVNAALKELSEQINEWVEEVIPPDYPKRYPHKDDKKVIREAVSGYQVLKPHEYLILDSPIVQRLRYIHQTALSYLVYPTSNHTRFDHSLGVAHIAELIGRSLEIEDSQIEELRMAALLHDIGHAFFSHLSEELIATKFQDTFESIKEIELFHDRESGEIMTYLIVASPRFQKLLADVFNHYNNSKISIDRITHLVIGKTQEPERFAFLGDIISGPFDADKLDYLVRDCRFSGIRADADVERVIISSLAMNTSKYKGFQEQVGESANRRMKKNPKLFSHRYLIMKSSGVNNLEQIVLNKILLFPAIYHHHKVRALECMVKGIFEVIWANPEKQDRDKRLKFEKPTDFLRISESDFFSLGMSDSELSPLIKRLLNRDLLKRCLVLAPNYVIKDPELRMEDFFKLSNEYPKLERLQQMRKLREFIWDDLPKKHRSSFSDLWVDIPKPPNIDKDVNRCWIDIGTDWLVHLREFFPYGKWLDTYGANKLKGHVFYIADPDHRKAVNKTAKAVFRDAFVGVKFDPRATDECKLENYYN